jgi:ribonuclease P protein component
VAGWFAFSDNIQESMHAMQLFKLVKKAAKRKQVKRGVKEVIKSIRKKTSGCVVR